MFGDPNLDCRPTLSRTFQHLGYYAFSTIVVLFRKFKDKAVFGKSPESGIGIENRNLDQFPLVRLRFWVPILNPIQMSILEYYT